MDSCLNFKAATNPKVAEKFSDSGIIVCTCRHDIPLRLVNIRGTGEKLCYAQTILLDLLNSRDCAKELVNGLHRSN